MSRVRFGDVVLLSRVHESGPPLITVCIGEPTYASDGDVLMFASGDAIGAPYNNGWVVRIIGHEPEIADAYRRRYLLAHPGTLRGHSGSDAPHKGGV